MLDENIVYRIKDKVFLFTDSYIFSGWKLLIYGYESELENVFKYPICIEKIIQHPVMYDNAPITKDDILGQVAYYKAFENKEVQILALNDLVDVILVANKESESDKN